MKKNINKTFTFYLSIFTLIGVFMLSCEDKEFDTNGEAIQQLTITELSPNIGDIGFIITVTGTNFSPAPANNKVFLNGIPIEVINASLTGDVLTIEIPEGATTGNIVISHGQFTATGPVLTIADFPAIDEVDPERGAIGETIIITGEKFGATPGDNTVFINGLPAIITAATTTSITTTVPDDSVAGIDGLVVTVNSLSDTFENFIVDPAITTVTPLLGQAGDEVTITGTSFSAAPEENTVKFNGALAAVTTASSTSITAILPVNATSGPVTVTVNNLTATGPNFVIGAPPTTITVAVDTEEDDVEESTIDGEMNLTSGDLELGELDSGAFAATALPNIGIRINNINIPQGANIISSLIQFRADNDGSDPTQLTIYGEAIDNAPPYTATSGDLSARALTTANAVWNIEPWLATGDRLPAQQTVDLSTIIQEIVNRPGWVSGNSINFILKGTGVSAMPSGTSSGREAEGFSSSTTENNAELTVIFN